MPDHASRPGAHGVSAARISGAGESENVLARMARTPKRGRSSTPSAERVSMVTSSQVNSWAPTVNEVARSQSGAPSRTSKSAL